MREAEREGKTVGEVCRRHGITEGTFYRWRNKYGGLEPADVKRRRELEYENSKLKRLLAERDLEIDGMKALLSKKW